MSRHKKRRTRRDRGIASLGLRTPTANSNKDSRGGHGSMISCPKSIQHIINEEFRNGGEGADDVTLLDLTVGDPCANYE